MIDHASDLKLQYLVELSKLGSRCALLESEVQQWLIEQGFVYGEQTIPFVIMPHFISPGQLRQLSRAVAQISPLLDRFCDALISIRKEIAAIESGEQPREGNALKNSPHTMKDLIVGEWDRSYSRELAAYPLPWLKEKKFWPSVTRLDDAYGDMNLFCRYVFHFSQSPIDINSY